MEEGTEKSMFSKINDEELYGERLIYTRAIPYCMRTGTIIIFPKFNMNISMPLLAIYI